MATFPARSARAPLKPPATLKTPRNKAIPRKRAPKITPDVGAPLLGNPSAPSGSFAPPPRPLNLPNMGNTLTPGAGHMSNASNPLGRGGVGAGQEKWIQGAIKKPGALHADLGVPQGQKIPAKKLNAAAKGGGKTAQRARLAKTLKKF